MYTHIHIHTHTHTAHLLTYSPEVQDPQLRENMYCIESICRLVYHWVT